MELWYSLRRFLLRSRLVNRIIFDAFTLAARRRAIARLRVGSWDGLPLIRPAELRQRLDAKSSTCHVIGAGWSLNESKHIIRKDDFVIGFNFAALADLKFDMYLCELHTHRDPRRIGVSDLQARLIRDNLGSRIHELYFHSPWLGFLDASMIRDFFGPDIRCLSDYQLSSRYIDISEHMRDIVVEALLRHDPDMSSVVATTSITATALAYRLGFRTIVLHGLDGGGPHFFATREFSLPPGYEEVLNFYPRMDATSQYFPGTQGLQLLPALRVALHRRGVALLAATQSSPSSKLLDVYSLSAERSVM